MNSLNTMMRRYVEDCTDDATPAVDLKAVGSGAAPARRTRSWLIPVVAAVATTALVVAGVVVLRNEAQPGPAPVALLPTSALSADILGTWVPGRPAGDLAKQERVTFQTDGRLDGWDGCNSFWGRFEVGPGGDFEARVSGSTLVGGCDASPLEPVFAAVAVETSGSKLTLLDASGATIGELRRPGGRVAPTAQLLPTGTDEFRLAVTTWGSSSCPFEPVLEGVEGGSQIEVSQVPVRRLRLCTDDLMGPSTEFTGVATTDLDLAGPITLTLSDLFAAPVTVPVDTSRVASVDESLVGEQVDVGIVLIGHGEAGVVGDWARRGLTSREASIVSTGDRGLDAVRALFETPSPGGGSVNGWNMGFSSDNPIAMVQSVAVEDTRIVVDLDRPVVDPYPTIDCDCPPGDLVMQQLVWTLHEALDTDLPVLLTVDGEPARAIWFQDLTGPVAADPSLEPAN